ncbi:MAG TPA: phosphatidate cytidylyltransferase, partial [Puia sp.]|nr:phosphatidate cytidylyltransferase [Puia sp.]
MALNKSVFRTRAISAIIFAVVMLAGLLWNFWSFFILFSIIHFGCWIEYQKLIGRIDKDYASISSFHKYGVIIAGWCTMFYFSNDYKIFSVPLHLIGQWAGLFFLIVLPLAEIIFVRKINFKIIGYSLLGLLYISLSWGLLTDIRSKFSSDELTGDIFGKILVILIVTSIWINDTMAYIVGSLIGKTPFSKISPKKTWEGTIGGIILAIVVMSLISYFAASQFDWDNIEIFASIAAIASIAGTIGDLLESKLK